jgi:hypothetical protein
MTDRIFIRPIKIMLDTNIPEKSMVPFTKSLLYNPILKTSGSLNEYPYFTQDVQFPYFLYQMTYEECVRFFFNKDEMMKLLMKYTSPERKDTEQPTQEFKTQFDIDKQSEKERERIELRELKKKLNEKEEEKKKSQNVIDKNKETKTLLKGIEEKMNDFAKKFIKKIKEKDYTIGCSGDTIDRISKSGDQTVTMNDLTSIMIDTDIFTGLKTIYQEDGEKQTSINELMDRVQNPTRKTLIGEGGVFNNFFKQLYKCEGSTSFLFKMKSVNEKLESIDEDNALESESIEKLNKEINNLQTDINKKETSIVQPSSKTNFAKEEETIKQKQKNGDTNISIMLNLLFPTKYPVRNNYYSSYNSLITNTSELSFSFYDLLPSFLKFVNPEEKPEYSYVKIDDKVYTVTQIIWLNDIYNQPDFANLMKQFQELNKWKKQTEIRLDKKISSDEIKFKENYKEGFSTKDIETLEETKEKVKQEIPSEEIPSGEIPSGKLRVGFVDTTRQKQERFINDMKKLINAIKTFQESVTDQTDDYETIGDNAESMIALYKECKGYGSTFFTEKESWRKIITNVARDINNIRMNTYINYTYISKAGFDIEYINDNNTFGDRKIPNELQTNYKEYTNFAENIKKLRAPNKESSNIYLQTTINDFLENREKVQGVFNFLMNAQYINRNPYPQLQGRLNQELNGLKKDATNNDNKIKTIEKQLKNIENLKPEYILNKNTSVSINPSAKENEPYFEIFIQLNLIGGELNDSNKGLIDCMYQGESLGSKLEVLINSSAHEPWDLNNNRMFFDITKDDIKEFIDKKEAEQKEAEDNKKDAEQDAEEKNPIKRALNPIKKGFNDLTRKARSNFMRLTKRKKPDADIENAGEEGAVEKDPIKRFILNPLKKGYNDLTRKARSNFMRLTRRQKPDAGIEKVDEEGADVPQQTSEIPNQ